MMNLQNNVEKLCNSIFNTYDQENKDVLKIKHMLIGAVENSFWKHIRNNYWAISWSSPIGEDSEDVLKALGFIATWDGTPGYRGNVTIFIPKSNFKECPNIKKWFETLVKLDSKYQKLLDTFDKDSIFFSDDKDIKF